MRSQASILSTWAILILAMLFNCPLWSQNGANFIHLPFKLENQGVKVTHSVQDSLGFVWLAHENGISKYDGYNFEFVPSIKILKFRRSLSIKNIEV